MSSNEMHALYTTEVYKMLNNNKYNYKNHNF